MAASDDSVTTTDLLTNGITDFSSDSAESDGWQELTKSDYAKVIFSDIVCNFAAGTVECKFQITDNVHEDPNDCVGLFRVGYEDLSQCLVSKMLSQTKCEDDGKLQRCAFTTNELPYLDDGFYQFLYVTRDKEVCGASMPFQIMSSFQQKESSVGSGASENMVAGFLLVNNECERQEKDSDTSELDKLEEEKYKDEEASVQRNVLSEEKKEEIAAWVSQNPDYYSLIEQIKEHTYTINALQESKDLAMKEVAQLYELLNKQNGELIQSQNMLAAYEEKFKMSVSLQEEKNTSIDEMNKSLSAYEEKTKSYEFLLKEKDEQISQLKTDFYDQEKVLESSYGLHEWQRFQIKGLEKDLDEMEKEKKQRSKESQQQQAEISALKKELEEMKKMQEEKENQQVTAEAGENSLDTVIQKTQELLHMINTAIKKIDFTDKSQLEKFFQLKIQLLIISSKMARATDLANICDRNGLHKTFHSMIEKDAKGDSFVGPTSCALESIAPFLTNSNTNVPEVEMHDCPSSCSFETLSQTESESENNGVSKEVAESIPVDVPLKPEDLENQIVKLPHLNDIGSDFGSFLSHYYHLQEGDITRINLLTSKIKKRSFDLFEALELGGDDSSSDFGSDMSEVSECSSSVKKDLDCVTRVIESLSSYLSGATTSEQLVEVESEEDKNLMQRNQLGILLKKCALHYQIEIMIEHMEKQREGIKKVSEKICEVLSQCMVLKDEVSDLKADRERLQATLHNKEMLISVLDTQLDLKNAQFHDEKERLENRAQLAEKINEDFHARLIEASNLYKQQFCKIEKLKEKLRKYKSLIDKTKSSKREPSVTSSESSKISSSFEVVLKDSVQNVNDSDTGEHMFEKASLVSREKSQDQHNKRNLSRVQPLKNLILEGRVSKPEDPCSFASTEIHGAKPKVRRDSNTEIKAVAERCMKFFGISAEVPDLETFSSNEVIEAADMTVQKQTSSNEEFKTTSVSPSRLACEEAVMSNLESTILVSKTTVGKPNTEIFVGESCQNAPPSVTVSADSTSYEQFQEIIKENFADIKKSETLRNSSQYFICCFLCKENFSANPDNSLSLMNHLENEHSMKICPVCGQLFEEAIPQKYFSIHVHQHFETQ